MAISITCEKCKHSFRVKDEYAGRRGKCPKCQEVIQVPATNETSDTKQTPPKTASNPEARQTANRTVAGKQKPVVSESISLADLNAALKGRIEPVPQSWTYTLGLLLAGIVMIILPVIYVCVICLVVYGVYLHLICNTWLFGLGRVGYVMILAAIAYFGVAFAGVLTILFMIKPIFARSAEIDRRRSLTRDGEPFLFAFVDRICDAVGTVRPQRIDVDCQVNASAGFRRGIWSMIAGNDLVLTIGLPLVAGIRVEQLAAVLAHEFGHFSQGAAMRLTFIIRAISYWFIRVVYERDHWDQKLVEASESTDGRIGFVLYLARFLVWCTRKILWVLMMIGHAVAGFLLRQMEFDADRYETRMAGSAVFEQTTRRLAILTVAYEGALADLAEFHREGRLGDNLPKLVIFNAQQIPPKIAKKIDAMIDESKTGLLDTHPSDKDRIINSRRENSPGLFHAKQPAKALFSNFDQLSRNVTWDFFRGVFGPSLKPSDMHPIDTLLKRQSRSQEHQKAIGRYFQGCFSALRIIQLPAEIGEGDVNVKAAAANLARARKKMLSLVDSTKDILEQYNKYDSQLTESEQADALLHANLRLKANTFSVRLTSLTETKGTANTARQKMQDLGGQLSEFEDAACQRIAAALLLLDTPPVAKRIADAAARRSEVDDLLPILNLFYDSLGKILELRNTFSTLATLVGNLEANQQNESLLRVVRVKMAMVSEQIRRLSEAMSKFRYPLDHAKGNISIAAYALEKVPMQDDLGAILECGGQMLDNLMSLYVRIVGRLVDTSETVETAIGLPQLPEPEENAE